MKYLGFVNGKEVSSFYEFEPAFAYVTDNGDVSLNSEEGMKILNKIEEEEERLGEINGKLSFILNIVTIMFSILSLIFFFTSNKYFTAICSMAFFSKASANVMPAITKFFMRIGGNKDVKKMCKFHAAEHAAINAYYDLYRVPTMEEIKRYSIYSYNCGIPELIKTAWWQFGLGICVWFPNLYFIIAIFVFIIISFWAKKVNFFFTEIGFLSCPTELEYEIAIKVMEEVLKLKEESNDEFEEAFKNSPSLDAIKEIEDDETKRGNQNAYRFVF